MSTEIAKKMLDEIDLYNVVKDELCPGGVWHFSQPVDTLVKRAMFRLPKRGVSEAETRYPITPAGMRAFFDTFFARHYFQIQNTLLDYLASPDLANSLKDGKFSILDIGSGPAVASLAITDMLACVFRNVINKGGLNNVNEIKINYFLNDTSGICLGMGQELLRNYFSLNIRENTKLFHERTISLQTGFPANMNQLMRIYRHFGPYDLINFCYVINPLNEQIGLRKIIDGIRQAESLTCPVGRILILQDRFSESLIKKISRGLNEPCQESELTQVLYPKTDEKRIYTYSYRYCIFAPRRNDFIKTAVSA
jgi:ribosomal protein RSM22 (predicted rRNA methylase)